MAKTFRVSLYTPQDLADAQVAESLWGILDVPQVAPRRFDSIERARTEFASHAHAVAQGVYLREGMLFVRGARDSFTAMFMRSSAGLAVWNFWWDLKAMQGSKCDSWVAWLCGLCEKLPPYYGLACSTAEYDAKHTVVESDESGTVTYAVGVSVRDFFKMLPGVHWLNVYGAELVEHFSNRFDSLNGVRVARVNDSQVVVILDFPVLPEDMTERLRFESELRALLGSRYFYDPIRPEPQLEQVPEVLEALRRDNPL